MISAEDSNSTYEYESYFRSYHKLTTGQKIVHVLKVALKFQKDLSTAIIIKEWMSKSDLQKWIEANKDYIGKI